MCGITGWIDFRRDLREWGPTVDAMTDVLAPRGPDARGTWLTADAAFGHRRLSIIDLDGGVQPMIAHDEHGRPSAAITYGGEIYNYRELRDELVARGHAFRTRSDTEVLLRGYLEWGEGLPKRLNGMYAFAVWDVARESLMLVRDRLGIKPLYWTDGPGHLLFGSEPKSILANPLFTPELGPDGIAELFALATAPTPGHGIYRGLRQVRPGHLLTLSRRDGIADRRYWSLPSHEHEDDLPTTVATVRELLQDSVTRQLESDVPLGFLLSGGVDSSALASLSAAGRGRGQGSATYSVDFPDDEAPEVLGSWNLTSDRPYVDAVVDRIGSDHSRITVRASELLHHRSIGLDARDLPGWGEPDTSLYLLFRGVRPSVTVAISGEVADELFGGYSFFDHCESAATLETFPWLRGKVSPSLLLRPEVADWADPAGYATERFGEALAEVPWRDGEPAVDVRARRVTHLALTRWLPAVLERKDRMSMASGLEARVPFADHRLVEYLWNVPWAFKATGGVRKGLLRAAVADLLPEAVLNRPKSGYPASSADAYGAVLRGRVEQLLRDDNAPVFQLVDRRRVAEHLRSGEILPGPRAAPHPTGGLDFLLTVNRWLTDYGVRIG